MTTLIFEIISVPARCLHIYAVNRILCVYIGIITLESVRTSNFWMRAQLIFRASRAFLVDNTFLICPGGYFSQYSMLIRFHLLGYLISLINNSKFNN